MKTQREITQQLITLRAAKSRDDLLASEQTRDNSE